jgi:iron complex outermembrane receptor protein
VKRPGVRPAIIVQQPGENAMFSRVRPSAHLVVLLVSLLSIPFAGAQTGTRVSGLLLDSVTAAPVSGTITIEELKQETTSAPDGTFAFENVPPGRYHFSVRAPKFRSGRTEVSIVAGGPSLTLTIDPEIHYEEVVSVSPEARSQFESYQPTTVLAGQELEKQLEMSLGETLESQPGLASRSFGPAPARPVIRGLDGDRVLILQDGQRLGDLSSQSGDHGVPINPAAAQRIEVIRGPATLLYGANAIGGLVNVITDEIPREKQQGTEGNLTFDLGSGAREASGAGDVHWGNGVVALHVGGSARRTGDVRTPEGEIENSQSRSGTATVGLSWTGEKGFFGGSYGYDDTKYGIPVVEDGTIQLTPRRHAFSLRAGAQGLDGIFDSFRATVGHRRYRHEELEGAIVGTLLRNTSSEVEVLGSHRAVGVLKGSVGGWVLDRGFEASGAEALSPPVDQRSFAAFVYEELTWPHATFQFGGRVERTEFDPRGEQERDFTSFSGSLGLLVRPAAANDRITFAVSVARAVRNPALEELFFLGEHHGNFAFEIGNPNLASEKGLGFDVSFRWRSGRASGEVTYFRNDIADYIFRSPIAFDEFEAREAELEGRFPGRQLHHEAHDEAGEEGLQFVEFTAADSVLQGIEAHADVQVTEGLVAETGFDYVRGALSDLDAPLPRIPPMRIRGGLRYQRNALQAGGEVVLVAEQDRVFGAELPTEGYQLVKLFTSYSFVTGAATSTITARVDNITDELYRNHLSLIKQFVPEMGRSFKLLYNVRF